MNEINYPIHSTKNLMKAVLAALVIATIIFVTVVLPSEYNIDPLGVGEKMGLTALSQPAAEVEDVQELKADEPVIVDTREDIATIIVPANRGIEYKFYLKQYEKLGFEWSTDGTPLYFDFHGEPEGDTTGFYESYSITTSDKAQGKVTVPFAGVHGWYWKNETDSPIEVTLKTQGNYQVIGNPRK